MAIAVGGARLAGRLILLALMVAVCLVTGSGGPPSAGLTVGLAGLPAATTSIGFAYDPPDQSAPADASVPDDDIRSPTSAGVRASEAALGVAAEAEGAGARGLSEAFHYTGAQNAASIEANGLRAGSYATPSSGLSPLQAQIDLALPPNRGLPGSLIRIDLDGLRAAGYDIPGVGQVGRSFNMPGGGFEMQFPYSIPSEFLKVIR